MDTKFSNMKKLFILCTILFSTNILNAQTIQELEGRYTPPTSNSGYNRTYNRSGWDDFVDAFTPEDQTWGLGYSYSQNFPLTLSANYTYSCLSVATEFGFNFDGKKYTTNEYNPIGYLVVSPGFYCRFLSINCGVGFMSSRYTKTTTYKGDSYTEDFTGESEDGSTTVDGSITISTSYTYSRSATKYDFVLKPSITGYIPVSDEDFYITINAGYNYIPKFKELNGWSFGVGFQWVIW